MDCIVCGNPVTVEGSNVCGFACLMKTRHGEMPRWDARRPRKVGKNAGVAALVSKVESMRKSATPDVQEVPMLRVKHPWMRGRNVVSGSTVFSFDMNGIAEVPRLGSVLEDLDMLLRKPGSQFEVITDPVVAQPTPVAPPPAPKPVEPVAKVSAPEVPAAAPEAPKVAAPLPEEPVQQPAAKQKRRIKE
jgi:hypothetical protein